MAYAIRSCSVANLLSWPSANNNSAFIVCCIALLVLIDAMVGTLHCFASTIYQLTTISTTTTRPYLFVTKPVCHLSIKDYLLRETLCQISC
jgi:uncharacterized membrane protein